MKMSTRGRYGIKAMLELALSYDTEMMSVRSIAQKQKISELYLEQLFSTLKKANLIKSVRGAKGGYSLTRKPKEITIKDIIDVVEGPINISDCAENNSTCDNLDRCATRVLWVKIRDAINNIFSSVTLQDIIDEHNKLNFINIGVDINE
ncbi:RrF2 family transcriptional regulator [Candidatus Arthromitus sp. SFB-rat-Yit]|uniref:RrF2 family transcriptional regulator n=1 Tax=Candidatus Arthromitus sp. SFB-rat-Yit TaxID=1041504 RepID=UPI000227A0EA|nr:Rrf2 family transcriptional regulator [Candidatus Arthromitus sp. SFB-rat-Yit]BAK81265.1 RRF2 family protein [Candidatus Arthromitus sp. SFB-rat-Yit]